MARHRFSLVAFLADGLVGLDYDGDEGLWSRCKIRKPVECAISGVMLSPGHEVYRPLGNVDYRMLRISAVLIDEAVERSKLPLDRRT